MIHLRCLPEGHHVVLSGMLGAGEPWQARDERVKISIVNTALATEKMLKGSSVFVYRAESTGNTNLDGYGERLDLPSPG